MEKLFQTPEEFGSCLTLTFKFVFLSIPLLLDECEKFEGEVKSILFDQHFPYFQSYGSSYWKIWSAFFAPWWWCSTLCWCWRVITCIRFFNEKSSSAFFFNDSTAWVFLVDLVVVTRLKNVIDFLHLYTMTMLGISFVQNAYLLVQRRYSLILKIL